MHSKVKVTKVQNIRIPINIFHHNEIVHSSQKMRLGGRVHDVKCPMFTPLSSNMMQVKVISVMGQDH